METPPHETERHEAHDKSHLDFIHKNADGSWSGIRVWDKHCRYITTGPGEIGTPQEIGSDIAIPLAGNVPENIRRERAFLADPELDKLLAGKIELKDVFGKWMSAGSGC